MPILTVAWSVYGGSFVEFSVQRKGFECLCQIFEVQFATHVVSETISPVTPLKPNFDAAMAAAAIVFTLFGAMGQSSATEPWYKTRLPSPSVQSESRPPVSRKQEGCLDIRMERAYKTFEMYFHIFSCIRDNATCFYGLLNWIFNSALIPCI